MPFGLARTQGFNTPVLLNFAAGNTIINGSGLFIYSGNPAAGNLIYSDTNAAGHDKFLNNYLPGETSYDNGIRVALNIFHGIINWYTFTANPGAVFTLAVNILGSASGLFLSTPTIFQGAGTGESILAPDSVSILSYQATGIVAADGNTYQLGQTFNKIAANQLISSAGFTVVSGSQVQVAVRTYRLRLRLLCVGNQAAGAASFQYGGTATVGHADGFEQIWLSSSPAMGYVQGSLPAGFVTATMPAGNFMVTAELDLNVTVAGTFNLQAACSIAADTYNIKSCYAQLIPT